MNLKNPFIKHGLSEIENAVTKEVKAEVYEKLLERINRKKQSHISVEELKRILGEVFFSK